MGSMLRTERMPSSQLQSGPCGRFNNGFNSVVVGSKQVNVDHLRTRGAAESTSSGAAPDAGLSRILPTTAGP